MPTEGLARLRRAEEDGRLADLAERLGLGLVVVFGSVARGAPDPRDPSIVTGLDR